MANMSYCRFENTLADLRDCFENWDDAKEEDMSTHEQKAKINLLNLCKDIAIDYGELEEPD